MDRKRGYKNCCIVYLVFFAEISNILVEIVKRGKLFRSFIISVLHKALVL